MIRYLKGTTNFGLYYDRDHDYKFYGYMDSDWAGSLVDRKSTSGGCYYLGSSMISWFSKKQSIVALNTAEEEYITAFFASCEPIWIRKLMSGLFDIELDTIVILCDNQSSIKMKDNLVLHDKSKHIEIWYFYIRDTVQKGAINI